MKTRSNAFELLNDYVKGESLRKHCLSVACAMEGYALKFLADGKNGDKMGVNNYVGVVGDNIEINFDKQTILDKWFITGLLHDFDFEKFPDIDKHGLIGGKILREKGFDEEIVKAIEGHNFRIGVKRESLMARTLFAVDELSGLIMALSYVRPGRFEGMNAKSVRKAMKKKDFAASINRDEIKKGIEELGVNEDEHFEIVIEALRKNENLH